MSHCLLVFGLFLLRPCEPVTSDSAPASVALEGVVTYTGPVPKPVEVIEAMAKRQLVEVEAKTKGLKDAVVWLEGAKAPEEPKGKRKPPLMDQQNYFFVPHVLAVRAGDEVTFLNSDGANHGVTATAAEDANSFNVTTAPGAAHKHRFVAARRPVRIGCPLHAGMAAWVCVFDHPYYAVTDKDGAFRLPPVPPGNYKLHVRHLDGGMRRTVDLNIKEGEQKRLSVEFGKNDLKVGE